jgi:hypothetical protein
MGSVRARLRGLEVLALVTASAVVVAAPGVASAAVTFDRAFGFGVDTGAAAFENCTTASTCQTGSASGAAGGMNLPGGVAVDAQGRILVADRFNHRVDRFAVAGDGTVSFDRAFGVGVDTGAAAFENCTAASTCQTGSVSGAAGGMNGPFGVAVDAQGRILVAESGNQRVARFAVAGDGTVTFDRTFGINVDPSDGTTGDFENCTAASTCQSGSTSSAAGGMDTPTGVAVDAQGRILVANLFNQRVDRFAVAGDGTVTFDRAFGVGVDTGAASFENCTTASTCQTGGASGAAGGMNDPFGVVVDAQGRILVTDRNGHRVDRFAVAGDGTVTFDRAFGIGVDTGAAAFENCTAASTCQAGSVSGAAGGMTVPNGVAVDAQGRILVADLNNRVARFAVAGDGTVTFDRAFGIGVETGAASFENCTAASTCQTGSASGAAGGMNTPTGIGVDAQGRILVADFTSNRVDRFSPGPTVTVTKALMPATDPGTFDLRVDAVVVRGAATDGQSGSLQVADGVDVTISEQGAGGTQLSDYTTTIDCGGGPQPGTSLTVTNVTANVNCTITDTRKPPPPEPFMPLDLTGLFIAPKSFGSQGATVQFRLSKNAAVTFVVERVLIGRTRSGRCTIAGADRKSGRRCVRYDYAGRRALDGVAGVNRIAFTGRLGATTLPAGRYRLSAIAASGLELLQPRTVRLRITAGA